MSNDATSMYSTWLSVDPRGYCDLSLRGGRASGLYRLVPEPDPDSDDVCDDTPIEGVLDFELGFEVRSVSGTVGGGWGERAARAW